MLLHHPEAIDKLDRRFVLFDWMYDINNSFGKVKIWGKHDLCSKDDIEPHTIERFGKYLFPDDTGRMEIFYSFDYLYAQGFEKVVTCPASACHGDTVFLPRTEYHMLNTWDSFQKGRCRDSAGSVLTSWTYHLFPWELQMSSIDIPDFQKCRPDKSMECYKSTFVKEHFGFSDEQSVEFWQATDLLSKSIRLARAASLGVGKHCNPVPEDFFVRLIDELTDNNQLEIELSDMNDRLVEYRQGLEILQTLLQETTKGQGEFQWWVLGAENLILHTECSLFLVKNTLSIPTNDNPSNLLERLKRQKEKTAIAYTTILKPTRREEIVGWLFDSVFFAVEKSLLPHPHSQPAAQKQQAGEIKYPISNTYYKRTHREKPTILLDDVMGV